jgi:alkylation response protein AidB-like acyl-CoA dehydrogenase
MIVPELPEDVRALEEAVGRLVEAEVYPLETRVAERGSIDPAELDGLRRRARDAGFGFSMLNMPPDLGGRDLSMLGQVALEEESGKATNRLGFAVVAGRVADRALQARGGRGYMVENATARFYGELRVDRIWEGTSEIQRSIISRGVFKRGAAPCLG